MYHLLALSMHFMLSVAELHHILFFQWGTSPLRSNSINSPKIIPWDDLLCFWLLDFKYFKVTCCPLVIISSMLFGSYWPYSRGNCFHGLLTSQLSFTSRYFWSLISIRSILLAIINHWEILMHLPFLMLIDSLISKKLMCVQNKNKKFLLWYPIYLYGILLNIHISFM